MSVNVAEVVNNNLKKVILQSATFSALAIQLFSLSGS